MFTVLTIDKRIKNGIFGGVSKRFSVNSLKHIPASKNNNTGIGYLNYISRNGRINWKKIGKKINKNGGQAVYSGKEEIPPCAGFLPFVPTELRQRLCANMALEVLGIMEDIPRDFKVGVYDPSGDFADFILYLLKFVDNPVVVTKNMKIYSDLADEIMTRTGALLRPVRSMSALSRCDFIISPEAIKERFTPKAEAVILTADKPKVSLACGVYYKYSFRLPKDLDRLRPEDTDSEAFGGALYSLCKVYQVGSLVPFVCMNDRDSQTTLSLKKYFTEQFGT